MCMGIFLNFKSLKMYIVIVLVDCSFGQAVMRNSFSFLIWAYTSLQSEHDLGSIVAGATGVQGRDSRQG